MHVQKGMVRDLQQILQNVESMKETVVDARGAARSASILYRLPNCFDLLSSSSDYSDVCILRP